MCIGKIDREKAGNRDKKTIRISSKDNEKAVKICVCKAESSKNQSI